MRCPRSALFYVLVDITTVGVRVHFISPYVVL